MQWCHGDSKPGENLSKLMANGNVDYLSREKTNVPFRGGSVNCVYVIV